MAAVLELKNIARTYRQGDRAVEVLNGASLTVKKGEVVALVGPSGSGKSTLLHAAGLLEPPDAGEVLIEGERTGDLSDNARTRLRRRHIGFVYQFHHLLPEFTALENVIMPQRILGRETAMAVERAEELLASLGLADRTDHRPSELSGGEQQRVAIARAVANGPGLLLADEPTGNLDEKTSASVFAALLDMVRDEGLAALIATHNQALARQMDRVLRLSDGRIRKTPKTK